MKYLHPRSLTWWSGIISLGLGITMIVCQSCNLDQVATVIAGLNGGQDASPASLILLGTGLIGIRDKLESIGKSE